MRLTLAFLVLFVPAVSVAQTPEIDAAVKAKLATIRYVRGLQTDGGGFRPAADANAPSLRATSAAVRTLKYLGSDVPSKGKLAAFVLSCFDPQTGGFADAPGGQPSVTLTSVGVMAAVELGIPREKFAKAMDYLKANAKGFEDIRIGAGAVEAWGVKDCPFDLTPWLNFVNEMGGGKRRDPKDGGARDVGSVAAFRLRLGRELPHRSGVVKALRDGQRDDGAWAKADATGSDLEATYRVMRAFYLLKEKPADVAKLRAFVAKCRNVDGGYGVAPGQPSNVGATYYAAIVTKWLDELER